MLRLTSVLGVDVTPTNNRTVLLLEQIHDQVGRLVLTVGLEGDLGSDALEVLRIHRGQNGPPVSVPRIFEMTSMYRFATSNASGEYVDGSSPHLAL